MKISNSPITFKYLALPHGLGGRGGVQRFFMLSQNIDFEEKLVPYNEEWAAEKERLVKSGENPCGSVPITYVKDADAREIPMTQHIASSRYLAQVHGVGSGDAYQDYVQDLVADEYQGFRDQWVHVAFAGSDEEKEEFRNTKLPALLKKFNALYEKFTGKGLIQEAAMSILEYAFGTLNFEYLIAATDEPNIPSQQTAKRLGMKFLKKKDCDGESQRFSVDDQ